MEKSVCAILLFLLSSARCSLQLDCAGIKEYNPAQPWTEDLAVEWIDTMIACHKGIDSNQILLLAVMRGLLKVVTILLERGEDVNATHANSGWTALMLAALVGNKDIAALLIEKGANINAVNDKGRNALMYTAKYGTKEIAALLIKKGADINAVDHHGYTALMHMAQFGAKEIVDLLLDAFDDLDVNAKNSNGDTALILAIKAGHNGVAASLLEYLFIDDDVKDKNGLTALMHAAKTGNEAIADLITDIGVADINAKDNDGNTALMYAVSNGSVSIASLLIEEGADISAKNFRQGWQQKTHPRKNKIPKHKNTHLKWGFGFFFAIFHCKSA